MRPAGAAGVGARGAWRGRGGHAAWACLCAQAGRAGWVSWAKLVHSAPGLVLTQFLEPVLLSTVPESLNEYCSLQNNF